MSVIRHAVVVDFYLVLRTGAVQPGTALCDSIRAGSSAGPQISLNRLENYLLGCAPGLPDPEATASGQIKIDSH